MIQKEGLTFGAPSSELISELFQQQAEHLHLTHLSTKRKILNFFRYLDDKLVIFGANHTDIQTRLEDFNVLHTTLKFTGEMETNKVIIYLDRTIHRTPINWRMSIYRKPTFPDTIIPHTSSQPTQHKYAAIKFLYTRLSTYNLLKNDYKQEEHIIHNIMHNNSFPIHPQKPSTQKPRKHLETTQTP